MVTSICIFSGRANSTENGPSAPGPKEILPVSRCRRMALILSAPPRAARTLATISSAVCAAARGGKTAHNDNTTSTAQKIFSRPDETFELFIETHSASASLHAGSASHVRSCRDKRQFTASIYRVNLLLLALLCRGAYRICCWMRAGGVCSQTV